jgi:CHRD domain
MNSKENTMIENALVRRALFALTALVCMAWVGSAAAATISFKVQLIGAAQVPPVTTAGKGTADLTWDPSTRVVTWDITYSGLTSPVTMAHFHDAPVGKNGPVAVWLSKQGTAPNGPIKGKVTLTPAQATQFEAGDWYVNVHTRDNPAGDIRGQVLPPKS